MPESVLKMTAHQDFRKGQRVIVFFRNGIQLVGKYQGKTSRSIAIDDKLFARADIRQIGIYKGDRKAYLK